VDWRHGRASNLEQRGSGARGEKFPQMICLIVPSEQAVRKSKPRCRCPGKPILIPPLLAVWLQVRVLSEPTMKSIAVQSPVCGRDGLSPQVSGEVLHRQSGLRASPLTTEKLDNQKPRAASFLFVRGGTQSYDEFIAAVPLLASPEHDARDDQHVRHFLDWRKRNCRPRPRQDERPPVSPNDSAQDGQPASGRSDAGLRRPRNRSGRIADFDRHLGSMGEGRPPAPTVRHVPFGHSPLALGRRRP